MVHRSARKYNTRRKKSPLGDLLYKITPLIANSMCHDHTEAIFVTCLHQVCTVCVMNSLQPTPKIALALMWPHIYLRERYPHPYYHCSESYRSQLYPRPVHHPACLYLFFSVRHLKGKFSRFITGRALKLP